jgi:hypothetical protein
MRAANALSVYATPLYQTWRKSSFGRLYAGEPRSSLIRSTNARRAMCATSARDGAPSATIFAEPWDLEVLARTASSQSYSAIFWTWTLRCRPLDANSLLRRRSPWGPTFRLSAPLRHGLPPCWPDSLPKRETSRLRQYLDKRRWVANPADIHSAARMGMDMTLCSRRAWITPAGLPTSPHPELLRRAALAVSD